MGAFASLAQILMQRRPGFRTPPFAGKTNPVGPVPGAPQPVPPPVTQTPGTPLGAAPAPAPASTPQATAGGVPLKQRVWDGLVNNPSGANMLLAAAQQLTRPRYPGETGMGNAVSAVTAGMNQLSQMRQLQLDREKLNREYQLKLDEMGLKKRETVAKEKDTDSNVTSRKEKAATDKALFEETVRHNTETEKVAGRNAGASETNAAANAKNAESLATLRTQQIDNSKKQLDLQSKEYGLKERELAEKKRQFDKGLTSREEYQNMQVALERQKVQLEATRLAIVRDKAAKATGELTDLKIMSEAADQIFNEEIAISNSTLKRSPVTSEQLQKRVNARYDELKTKVVPTAPDRIRKEDF